MKQIIQKTKKIAILGLILAMLTILVGPFLEVANAAALTSVSDTLSRVKASTLANHDIQFTSPTGVAAGQTITVTFPAEFTMGSVVFGDMDLLDDGVDITLAAVCATTTWGAALTGQVITFTSCTGTIAAASVIRIKIGTNATGGTNQITNPAAGSYKIDIAGTFGDTGSATVQILADDQVGVSATVPQSISFSISDVTIGFGSWTGTELRYATGDAAGLTTEPGAGLPSQLTASTNAPSGLTITIQSAGNGTNAGLYKSTSPTKLIAALGPNSVVAASEGYAAYGKADTGLTIATGFTATGTTALTTSAQTFLSTTGPVSSGVADLSLKAAIAGTTTAGSYSDTITLVCTGNF